MTALSGTGTWDGAAVLVLGATGIVGGPLVRNLRARGADVTGVCRRPTTADQTAWNLGLGPGSEPPALRRSWDVIVNAAASTRWTMDQAEAYQANVRTLESSAHLAEPTTQFVHLSTAFAGGLAGHGMSPHLGDYRNAYEWSKAVAEHRLAELLAPEQVAIVAPPLIIGDRTTGEIARFSGTYSLLHALTSGLLAAVVGDPDARIEVAPVDAVLDAVAGTAATSGPTRQVLGAGTGAMAMAELLAVGTNELNHHRRARGVDPVEPPPFIETERWERFFLPFGRDHFTTRQLRAVELLSEFQAYTTTTAPIIPSTPIEDPAEAYRASVRYWCERHHHVALRSPRAWSNPNPKEEQHEPA
ncbi:MAG: hypothetical protein JWM47_837 [Acidimicrobiales bacterium]|nr:hypothetical protein [Acidimicrobiales bacterium]